MKMIIVDMVRASIAALDRPTIAHRWKTELLFVWEFAWKQKCPIHYTYIHRGLHIQKIFVKTMTDCTNIGA